MPRPFRPARCAVQPRGVSQPALVLEAPEPEIVLVIALANLKGLLQLSLSQRPILVALPAAVEQQRDGRNDLPNDGNPGHQKRHPDGRLRSHGGAGKSVRIAWQRLSS